MAAYRSRTAKKDVSDDMDIQDAPVGSSRRSSRQASIEPAPPKRGRKPGRGMSSIHEESVDSSIPPLSMGSSQIPENEDENISNMDEQQEQQQQHEEGGDEQEHDEEHNEDDEEGEDQHLEEGGEEEEEEGEDGGEDEQNAENEQPREEEEKNKGNGIHSKQKSSNNSTSEKNRVRAEHDTFYDQFPESILKQAFALGYNGDSSFEDVIGTPETGTRILRFHPTAVTELREAVVDFLWSITKEMYDKQIRPKLLARQDPKEKIKVTSGIFLHAKKAIEDQVNDPRYITGIHRTKELNDLLKESDSMIEDNKPERFTKRRSMDTVKVQEQRVLREKMRAFRESAKEKIHPMQENEDEDDEGKGIVDI